MGSVCCCLEDDFADFANPNSSVYRNCLCLRRYLQNFLQLYTSLFHRQDQHILPSSVQGTSSSSYPASLDNSLSDMHRFPPRPLPYDADPRYVRLQRDVLVLRREKGSTHSHDEIEPLRNEVDDVEDASKSVTPGGKCDESIWVGESTESNARSSSKEGFEHIYTFAEDEDVCPTCLEEYTTENPKIITKCSHHFHLACIYEWMERSDSCPVCGKVMAFDETAA